ncbi:MAG TPA: putative baseplate assembly protein [Acidimicrobiales bacterium]|nr:putative baseplate assembly protein [Acidimicrobiales bacterium]
MALQVPNLDDRKFQDLVDDAKRLVQQRCPEWTDHNVSDPGVTLIETFAYMVDQLIYRLNRVPDRNFVKFLDLIGVKLFPPTPATTDVTFWLSTPQGSPVVVPAGTTVATRRGEAADSAVTFTTVSELVIASTERTLLCTNPADGTWRNVTDAINLSPIGVFSMAPLPGDAFMIGLAEPVGGCAISVRMDCDIDGVGVDPDHPPLVWEAHDGASWVACEVEEDTTGGMNRAGEVILHVPAGHAMGLFHQLRAAWLRARLVQPAPGQPFYSASPTVANVDVATLGGTVTAFQGDVIEQEVLGTAEGLPGQRLSVWRPPVVRTPEPVVLEVSAGEGWEEWTEVSDFAASGPDDRHFVLDASAGEVLLGPAVRRPDGDLDYHGAVPPKGSVLRLRRYWTGGGRRGNVARGAIQVCRTQIPFVSRVENRRPATGGVDGETIEQAKDRGPISLRTLGRAVTIEDYEQLARQAAPEAARIRAVGATEDSAGVRVLLVPTADPGDDGRIRLGQLAPPEAMLAAVGAHLDRRRTVGARVVVEPPHYQGITVVARVVAHPWADAARVRAAALQALYEHLNPLTGGQDGQGWEFGRAVHIGEVYGVLQAVPDVRAIEDVQLFAADPLSGERGPSVTRVELPANALVLSFEHQVKATAAA